MFERRSLAACISLAAPLLANAQLNTDRYFDDRWYITPFGSYVWADNDRRSDDGWGGGLAHVERAKYSKLTVYKPRLLVFKLGGKARLPDPPANAMIVPELLPPPKVTATADVVTKGEKLFADNCAICHGALARGGVKDLRHMEPATHKDFLDIVIGGKRAQNGMASFADTLSRDEAEAIHQYVISRANADWEGH